MIARFASGVHPSRTTSHRPWYYRRMNTTIPSVPDANTPAVVVITKPGSVATVTGSVSVAPLTGVLESTTPLEYKDVVFTIFAPNVKRVGYSLRNISTHSLYICHGPGADITSKNYKLPIAPGGYFEEPQPPYQGVVTGIFAPGGVAHSDGVVACENYLP